MIGDFRLRVNELQKLARHETEAKTRAQQVVRQRTSEDAVVDAQTTSVQAQIELIKQPDLQMVKEIRFDSKLRSQIPARRRGHQMVSTVLHICTPRGRSHGLARIAKDYPINIAWYCCQIQVHCSRMDCISAAVSVVLQN